MQSIRDAVLLLVLLTLVVSVRVSPVEQAGAALAPEAQTVAVAAAGPAATIPFMLELTDPVSGVEIADGRTAGDSPSTCPEQRGSSHRVERRGKLMIVEVERAGESLDGTHDNCIHDDGEGTFAFARTSC